MKKYYKYIIILLFLICLLNIKALANSSDADKYVPIDLRTAISTAESKNLDYLAAKKNLEIAKQKIKIAGRFQNPSVSTQVNFVKQAKIILII